MLGKIKRRIYSVLVLGIIPVISCATTPDVQEGSDPITRVETSETSANPGYPVPNSQGNTTGGDSNMMKSMQQQMQQQMMQQMMQQNQSGLGGGAMQGGGSMGGGAPPWWILM